MIDTQVSNYNSTERMEVLRSSDEEWMESGVQRDAKRREMFVAVDDDDFDKV